MTNVRFADQVWFVPDDCQLEELIAVVGQPTDPATVPRATELLEGVPVYDASLLARVAGSGRREIQAELVRALLAGPGIVILRRAFPDLAILDAATDIFFALIEEQKASGKSVGDHFSTAGSSDRVWNALEKLAVAEPDTFTAYYGNEVLDLIYEAWLGPGYQMTSQINVVNPGGTAQTPHRDYHLGNRDPDDARRYAAHVHAMAPFLTLQGAVAHCEMPIETGPTMYLPHSHKYRHGYLVNDNRAFRDYFSAAAIQLPLSRGDVVFFNPALLHAAGANRSADIRRIANLLQISSPFGRPMEKVDRRRITRAVWPALTRMNATGVSKARIQAAIAATADGYPFPANLDTYPPTGTLARPSQADLLARAVFKGWDTVRFEGTLRDYGY